VSRWQAACRPPPHEDVLERSLVLLTALIGTTSYLQFGHLHGALLDEDAWFDRAHGGRRRGGRPRAAAPLTGLHTS
jgi:hypothetical protein